jgi:hypothetical protein
MFSNKFSGILIFLLLLLPNFWRRKQNIPGGLLGSSKSIFMPGCPVNGKCGHSAPDFV